LRKDHPDTRHEKEGLEKPVSGGWGGRDEEAVCRPLQLRDQDEGAGRREGRRRRGATPRAPAPPRGGAPLNPPTILAERTPAGAAAVAVWFLLYDLVPGVPFRTPALLGAVLFHGLRDTADLVISPRPVIEYTILHGIAFIAYGIALAGLFALADSDRRVVFGI